VRAFPLGETVKKSPRVWSRGSVGVFELGLPHPSVTAAIPYCSKVNPSSRIRPSVALCLVCALSGTFAACGASKKNTGQRVTVTVDDHVITAKKLGTIKRPAAMKGLYLGSGTCVRYGKGPSGEVYACP